MAAGICIERCIGDAGCLLCDVRPMVDFISGLLEVTTAETPPHSFFSTPNGKNGRLTCSNMHKKKLAD
jgi:hypothetical protein